MSDNKCKTETEIEIESLNLDHMDVEELEHRLEMAVGAPMPEGCYVNSCGSNNVP